MSEPDIVLLDLSMPGRSGWVTFEELSHAAPLVPIVIITALPAQAELARAACAAALVEKPIDIPTLVELLRKLLAEDETVRLARLAHRAPSTQIVRASQGGSGHWSSRAVNETGDN